MAVLGVATTDGRCRADPSAATPPNTATLRQVEATRLVSVNGCVQPLPKLEEVARLYWPRVRGLGAGSDADTGSAVKPSAPVNVRRTAIASAPGITALETTLANGSDGVPTRPHASERQHSKC